MGSGVSLPSTLGTHAELHERTKVPRKMVEDIFTYMIHHIKVNDFMKLSNPDGCRKYVMFMANNLSMFFSKLSVLPHLGKDGILAFRSIEQLEELKGEAKKEKESLCLVLAYFYTRIFQIYGAIALTLLDDIQYTVDKTALVTARPASESVPGDRTVPTPGQYPAYVESRAPKPLRQGEEDWKGVGGGISGLGYFDFLNSGILVERKAPTTQTINPYTGLPYPTTTTITTPANQYGYAVNYVYKDQRQKIVYFKTESTDSAGRDMTATTTQKGIFTLVENQKKMFEINVSSRKDDANTVTFTVDSIRYRKVGETTDTILRDEVKDKLTEDKVPQRIKIESSQPFPSGSQPAPSPPSTYSTSDYTSVNDYIKELLNALVPYISKQFDAGDSIAGRSTFDAMNIRRFYENYSNVKPLAHCIARAMQLLNADPYGKDADGKEFVSSICKTKFFVPYGKDTAERKGVTKPDEPITESPGIMALSILFYDTVGKVTPHIFMSNPSFQQYVEFMKQMTKVFVGPTAANALKFDKRAIHPRTAEKEREKIKLTSDGTTEIKDMRTFGKDGQQGFCSKEEQDKVIPLEKDTVKEVQGVVRSLFARQLKHAAECQSILEMLFTIEREPHLPVRIKISDRVLKGGLAELNRINAKTREILIRYYSDCEMSYLKGVHYIELQKVNQIKKKQEAAKAEVAKAEAAKAEAAKAEAAKAEAAKLQQLPTTPQQVQSDTAAMAAIPSRLAQNAARAGLLRQQQQEAERKKKEAITAAELAKKETANFAATEAQRRAKNVAAGIGRMTRSTARTTGQTVNNRGLPMIGRAAGGTRKKSRS